MKWWRFLIVGALLVVVFAALYHWYSIRAAEKRDSIYQLALKSYKEALPPGASRKVVDEYFRLHGVPSQHAYGAGSLDALSDYVRIGNEPAPWYCSSWGVYVVFDFAATEQHDRMDARETDILRKVRLEFDGEGCL